jgi:hypothetical protein
MRNGRDDAAEGVPVKSKTDRTTGSNQSPDDASGEWPVPRCPTCSGTLIAMGTREIRSGAADMRTRHAYWCPAGCRGPESDGMFEFFVCPACGSADTVTAPRYDGVEELECRGCGTISTLHIPEVGPSD